MARVLCAFVTFLVAVFATASAGDGLTVEAWIDGGAELHLGPKGMYWRMVEPVAKVGNLTEPASVDGKPWPLEWGRPTEGRGLDETKPIGAAISQIDLRVDLLAVCDQKGGSGIEPRTPVVGRIVGEEFVVSILDRQPGAKWYRFRILTPDQFMASILSKPVTLFVPYTPLYKEMPADKISVQYAVIALCNQVGLPYDFESTLDACGVKAQRWIKPDFRGIPFGQALSDLLLANGLTCDIKDGRLYLLPLPEDAKNQTEPSTPRPPDAPKAKPSAPRGSDSDIQMVEKIPWHKGNRSGGLITVYWGAKLKNNGSKMHRVFLHCDFLDASRKLVLADDFAIMSIPPKGVVSMTDSRIMRFITSTILGATEVSITVLD